MDAPEPSAVPDGGPVLRLAYSAEAEAGIERGTLECIDSLDFTGDVIIELLAEAIDKTQVLKPVRYKSP